MSMSLRLAQSLSAGVAAPVHWVPPWLVRYAQPAVVTAQPCWGSVKSPAVKTAGGLCACGVQVPPPLVEVRIQVAANSPPNAQPMPPRNVTSFSGDVVPDVWGFQVLPPSAVTKMPPLKPTAHPLEASVKQTALSVNGVSASCSTHPAWAGVAISSAARQTNRASNAKATWAGSGRTRLRTISASCPDVVAGRACDLRESYYGRARRGSVDARAPGHPLGSSP